MVAQPATHAAGIAGALYYSVEGAGARAVRAGRVGQAPAARTALRRFAGRDVVELSELALWLWETRGEEALAERDAAGVASGAAARRGRFVAA